MQTITIAPPKRSWFSLLSWAVVLAVLVVSWQGAEMAPLTLIKDGGNMATFAADFFPPDFSQWQDYLTEMAVTLQIAVWGTALAVVLSIPFGLMSAENLVPWWVYQPVRRLMDACRAINEMVFAMLFVVAVGLGPFAGVLACWRCLSTPPACSPSCFPKRWKRLNPAGGRHSRHRCQQARRDPLRRAATGDATADLLLPLSLRIQRPLGDRRRHGRRRRDRRHPVGSDSRFPVPTNLRPDGAYHRHGQPAGFPLSTVA
ncbi:phosphonate/organophosphate ester transporter subunit, membrane component of ABC superfamily [Escherichia coli]|nr:phosphonate/organophosphate ester transporter subunit, membrane component of ABC superfamily [Escherichia coli]